MAGSGSRSGELMVRRIRHYGDQIEQDVQKQISMWADEVEDWMWDNHPWQNRTRNAERDLHAISTYGNKVFQLYVEGNWQGRAPYMKYLEKYHPRGAPMSGQKFDILWKALNYWTPILWERLRRYFATGRIQGRTYYRQG